MILDFSLQIYFFERKMFKKDEAYSLLFSNKLGRI